MRRGERGVCLRLIGGAAGEVEGEIAGDCGAPGSPRCRFAARVLRSAESCAWGYLATPAHGYAKVDSRGEESKARKWCRRYLGRSGGGVEAVEVEEGEVCELQGGNQPTCITGSGSAARASAGLSVRSEAMSSCLTTATCVCGYVCTCKGVTYGRMTAWRLRGGQCSGSGNTEGRRGWCTGLEARRVTHCASRAGCRWRGHGCRSAPATCGAQREGGRQEELDCPPAQ